MQFRRFQIIEFSFAQKARELEAKSMGGIDNFWRDHPTILDPDDLSGATHPREGGDRAGGISGKESEEGVRGEGGCKT